MHILLYSQILMYSNNFHTHREIMALCYQRKRNIVDSSRFIICREHDPFYLQQNYNTALTYV